MIDTIIIGGGAAGLCTSIMLKQKVPNLSVAVLEKNDRVGKKLSITGNGRCNISNKNIIYENYHGDSDLAIKLLSRFDVEKQRDFFRSIGVIFTDIGDNRLYPLSMQASSVTDALRFYAAEKGVIIKTDFKVESITRENGLFQINEDETLIAKTVVVAAGGTAGGKLGNSDGYELLKKMGHKVLPTFPAITQLKTETDFIKRLKGIKTEAKVTLCSSLGHRTEKGELLFCDYGISGPPVLQVSRLANGENPYVLLDLIPTLEKEEIIDELSFRSSAFKNRKSEELFTGLMNKKLGAAILFKSGVKGDTLCGNITKEDILKTADNLKELKLKVLGTTGLSNAQVTAGGADTAQFFDNLMSKKAKGLFAVGEVLNVDGDCGGFNLAFAWSSAFAAAEGIISYLEK
jgi:predicted Rossmann fold flavoprotein